MGLRHALIVSAVLLAVACGGGGADRDGADATPGTPTGAAQSAASTGGGSEGDAVQRHPDIVDVEITPAGDGTFDLAVTVSSPYDTPDRYADGWRVLAPDGTELGTHTLLHDHAGEQPFTRTQTAVEIPPEVDEVTVEGRDLRYGFGGTTVTIEVPHEER